jgi:hypothetical protein
MEIANAMMRSPVGPSHDLGIERGERYAHVGRMRGDAGLARAEDCVHAVEAVIAEQPLPGCALLQWCRVS